MVLEDRATLLRVGPNVTTACSDCSRDDFLSALDDMQTGAGRADMNGMLRVAAGLARRTEGGSVLPVTIISDGQFGELPTKGLPPMSLNFVRVGSGSTGTNVAVVALNARRPPDGRTGWIAYARIENMGDSEVNITMKALADTVPLPDRPETLPPGGSVGLTWQVPAKTVRFTVSVSPADSLGADDSAVIFLPVEGQHRVAVVSTQPEPYLRAFSVIDGVAPVSTTLATADTFGFTVIDGAPGSALPRGGLVLVNTAEENIDSSPVGASYAVHLTGKRTEVRPTTILEANHPLLAGIDFSALLVSDANMVEVPNWLETLVDSPAGPLLLAGERDGRRVVVARH